MDASVDKRCYHHTGTDTYTCIEFIDHVTLTWTEGAALCQSRGAELMTHDIRDRLHLRLQGIVKSENCEFWINGK